VVSGEMCQLKALEVVKEIGIQGFSASHCWLQKFYNKQNNFYMRFEVLTVASMKMTDCLLGCCVV
jgi:hypothetical protein